MGHFSGNGVSPNEASLLPRLITYTYDSLNRLTKKTTPQETTTYTYDPGSRFSAIADADATLNYTYDSLKLDFCKIDLP